MKITLIVLSFFGFFNLSFSQTTNYFIFGLGVKGSTIYAGTNKGIYRSDDQGATWQSANKGIKNKENETIIIWNFFFYEEKIYATAGPKGFFVSSDGLAWEKLSTGFEEKDFITSIWVNEKNTFAGTVHNGMYMLLKNDKSGVWIKYPEGFNKNEAIRCFAGFGSGILAGTDSKNIYRSINGGGTWAKTENGPKTKNIYKLAVRKDNFFAACDREKIYFSSGVGDNWTPVKFELTKKEQIAALAANETSVFIGSNTRGVFLSNDDGKTWTQSIDGLENKSIMCFAV